MDLGRGNAGQSSHVELLHNNESSCIPGLRALQQFKIGASAVLITRLHPRETSIMFRLIVVLVAVLSCVAAFCAPAAAFRRSASVSMAFDLDKAAKTLSKNKILTQV
jgi:hypothetical protein